MEWKTVLAYITGIVDQELVVQNEYLVAENRILRNQITGRVRLTDGKRLGKKALAEVASVVKLETLLAWHRKLIAKKFDGSQHRRYPGRPRLDKEIEQLVVQFAKGNRTWGYDRIVGALKHVGYTVSDQTVGNILKRHAGAKKEDDVARGYLLAQGPPGRDRFFTAEVWTKSGLMTYYILIFIQVGSRKVHIAGITPHPDQAWMTQIARNSTMTVWGFLSPGQYLIHDRDGKFCPAFQEMIKAAGMTLITLPPRSPNLNTYAERWVRSVKEEVLSKLIQFGENALWQVLKEYDIHYHQERLHQGKGNELLIPRVRKEGWTTDPIRLHERLGRLPKYYSLEVA